jgi:hypothetical protein
MEVFPLSDGSDSETINEVETIRPTSVCRKLYPRCLSNAVGWRQSAMSNKSSRTATNSARTSSAVTPPEVNALLSVSLMICCLCYTLIKLKSIPLNRLFVMRSYLQVMTGPD